MHAHNILKIRLLKCETQKKATDSFIFHNDKFDSFYILEFGFAVLIESAVNSRMIMNDSW